MKPLETTVEEVLRKAIQDEVETRVYMQTLATRTSSTAVRQRLLQLSDGELVHRAKLERRYRELVGKDAPDPAPAKIEVPADVTDLDMSRALKLILEREREAESYFRFMSERVPSTTELGRLFLELADIEWKHKAEIQAEYDATGDPDRFLLDM